MKVLSTLLAFSSLMGVASVVSAQQNAACDVFDVDLAGNSVSAKAYAELANGYDVVVTLELVRKLTSFTRGVSSQQGFGSLTCPGGGILGFAPSDDDRLGHRYGFEECGLGPYRLSGEVSSFHKAKHSRGYRDINLTVTEAGGRSISVSQGFYGDFFYPYQHAFARTNVFQAGSVRVLSDRVLQASVKDYFIGVNRPEGALEMSEKAFSFEVASETASASSGRLFEGNVLTPSEQDVPLPMTVKQTLFGSVVSEQSIPDMRACLDSPVVKINHF